MSISTILNRWLKRFYKLLAIFLVLIALTISMLRLFLPYAYHYQDNIESYINTTYNTNISIGALAMGWGKSGPTLVIEQLELLSSENAQIVINDVEVEVNFWRSLQARKFVTDVFTLSGASVELEQALFENNNKVEQNKTEQSSNEYRRLINNLSPILLEQISRFSIRDSHVLYRSTSGVRSFTINEMFWVNANEKHRADGSVILDGLSSNNVKLLLNFKGKKFDNFTGQAYLEAHKINITPWLGQVLAIDDANTHSSINFNTWINVKAGKTERIQIALGNNNIRWQHNNSEHSFETHGGDIQIQSMGQKVYNISSTPITIKRNNTETNQISVLANVDGQHINGYINGIELASFSGVFPLLFKDASIENLLVDLAPTGRIEDIYFSGPVSDLAITANFIDTDSHYSHGVPGIDNASGELVYQNNKLHIALTANDGALDFDQHFKLPIQYNQLSTNIDVEFLENSWQLSARNIALTSAEINLTGNVNVSSEQDKPLAMSLLASVSDGDAKYAEHYYPLVMGENLYNYLDGAVVDGKVTEATVLFNGPLKSFPFNHNEGIFVVDATLTEATFKFDPQWPEIKNFSTNLNFTNNGMLITAKGGSLSGIDVNGVEARIDDLAKQRLLNVTANFTQIQPQLVSQLMNASPMQNSIGTVLEQVKVQGAINGRFSLALPLNNPEAVIAKGYVDFKHNQVLLQAPEMDFNKVNGRLYYHNDVISASEIKLDWRGMPVTLNALAKQKEDHYRVNIDMLSQWQESQWHSQVPKELLSYAQGRLDWQGKLVLNIRDDKLTYDYQANSNFEDVTLSIPEPFYKQAGQQIKVNVHAFGDKKRSTIDGKIGDNINLHSVLNHQQKHFSLAHLVLGNKQFWQPSEGFYITADLENANYELWQPLVLNILSSINGDGTEKNVAEVSHSTSAENQSVEETALPLLSVPKRINAHVKNLMVYGQNFHNINVNVTPEPEWWLLNVSAKEVLGTAKFYPDWYQQGIDVDLDFLHLSGLQKKEQDETASIAKSINEPTDSKVSTRDGDSDQIVTAKISNTEIKSTDKPDDALHSINAQENIEIFSNIPAMNVQCGSCKYGLYDFGNVSFSVERENKDLLILKKFIAKRDKSYISFDAKWQQNGANSQTNVYGLLNTDNVAREVEQVGYVSTIKDSGVAMNYDLSWQGGPHNLATPTLDGNLKVTFDDGYLADVDDNGVRIFSLLSLQSLVRKLSFDFRDVFSDGMFYKELTGSFSIKNGVAYTNDIFMDGSAGDLAIVGNTNLTTSELDYRMTYKPNLTSSLPVLAWIATLNPVTFLAGLALDEVITSSVIAEINFEVTGNLDKPLIKQVSRKTKNISVGRSSPPKILGENNESTKPIPKENTVVKSIVDGK